MNKIALAGILVLVLSFPLFASQSTAQSGSYKVATTIPLNQDQTFQQILTIYQNKSGTDWAKSMSELLDSDAVFLSWAGQQTDFLRGPQNILPYLNQQAQTYPALKKTVGRFMVAGGGVGGGADPYGSVLVLFYEASTHPINQKPWVWAGCDIITLSHGKIINWRVQEDTYMKLVKHPEHINIKYEYAIIDKFWHPTTTTNDKVGMAYLLDLKRTVMATPTRGKLLLERMSPKVEQSTWEPQGILYLHDLSEVKPLFFDGLLNVLPDFYENVERMLVSGNAFIMMQNPSGTQTIAQGNASKQNHRAWYNCDIFFFNGTQIVAMLFQRDTQMDINEEKRGENK